MRVGLGQVNELTDEFLDFAKQMGLEEVQMNLYHLPPNMKDTGRLEFQDLLRLRVRTKTADCALSFASAARCALTRRLVGQLPLASDLAQGVVTRACVAVPLVSLCRSSSCSQVWHSGHTLFKNQ